MSQPCLWAPSSAILKSENSGLSPKAFLRYLEEGELRVFARPEWLYDVEWRNSQSWPEAAWDREIDGKIRSICEEDSSKPKPQRRVVVAPPERGYEFADLYLDEHPGEVVRWTRILVNEKSSLAIPRGTREAALRDIDDPRMAVRRIFRDAYNHGQAIAYSEADAPLLVQQIHRDFLRVLADAPPLVDEPSAVTGTKVQLRRPAQQGIDIQLSNVAGQLIEILREFDIHARNRGDVDSLDHFIRGEGRKDLMRWMGQICALLKHTQPKELDNLLLERLRTDLEAARFLNAFESLLHRTDDTAFVALGLLSASIGLATDPSSLVALPAIAASIYPVGKGLLRQLGWAPDTFTGPQWPFLYTYGTKAKRHQLNQLRYVLNELHQREP